MIKKPRRLSRLFMIMHSSSDGVGGDIIAHGQTYDDLTGHLLDRYELIRECYGDQMDEDQPEVGEYIAGVRSRDHCTREDVQGFDLDLAGISLRCSKLFAGRAGFRDLVRHVKDEYARAAVRRSRSRSIGRCISIDPGAKGGSPCFNQPCR